MKRDFIESRLKDSAAIGRNGRASDERRSDFDLNPDMGRPDDLLHAAVLVPLVNHGDGVRVLLTQRTDHLNDHAGQISFPGGKIDPEDNGDPVTAALRETEEEIGIPRSDIEIVARLDDYETRTGFLVTPIVGFIEPPYEAEPDEFEVAEVFEVPLNFLVDPANREKHSRVYEGKPRYFYVMPYKDRYIWGATAGMLVNLADVLNGS